MPPTCWTPHRTEDLIWESVSSATECSSPLPSLSSAPASGDTKKSQLQMQLAFCDWWSRRESNPRPQAFTGQFYMLS